MELYDWPTTVCCIAACCRVNYIQNTEDIVKRRQEEIRRGKALWGDRSHAEKLGFLLENHVLSHVVSYSQLVRPLFTDDIPIFPLAVIFFAICTFSIS